jgi:hypothetical protein
MEKRSGGYDIDPPPRRVFKTFFCQKECNKRQTTKFCVPSWKTRFKNKKIFALLK